MEVSLTEEEPALSKRLLTAHTPASRQKRLPEPRGTPGAGSRLRGRRAVSACYMNTVRTWPPGLVMIFGILSRRGELLQPVQPQGCGTSHGGHGPRACPSSCSWAFRGFEFGALRPSLPGTLTWPGMSKRAALVDNLPGVASGAPSPPLLTSSKCHLWIPRSGFPRFSRWPVNLSAFSHAH